MHETQGCGSSGRSISTCSCSAAAKQRGRFALIEDGQLRSLEVNVEREGAGVLPLWAWVGLGAAVVTGATLGPYFATRSGDEPPGPIPGTMPPFLVHLGLGR